MIMHLNVCVSTIIMIQIAFTEEERISLQNLSEKDPHHIVRRKALTLLLKSYGISHEKICTIIGISGNTLRSYCKVNVNGTHLF